MNTQIASVKKLRRHELIEGENRLSSPPSNFFIGVGLLALAFLFAFPDEHWRTEDLFQSTIFGFAGLMSLWAGSTKKVLGRYAFNLSLGIGLSLVALFMLAWGSLDGFNWMLMGFYAFSPLNIILTLGAGLLFLGNAYAYRPLKKGRTP